MHSTPGSPARSLGSMLVGKILTTAARRFRHREAVFCPSTGQRASFLELEERSNRLANALLALGLPKGSVVAFLCANRIEILEIYFALAKCGLPGLPLNYRLAPTEVGDLLESMQARVLICEARFAATVEGLAGRCPGISTHVWIGADAPASCIGFEALVAGGEPALPALEIQETDVFYYNLTSGTTGLPKCYAITQFNFSALESTVVGFDLRTDDVFLTAFPAFGRVGFGWSLIAILMGARNILMDFDPVAALALIESERVTFTNLVPTMAALLLGRDELATTRLDSLRALCFVGAALPPTIRDETMARLCPRIYEAYGLQEAGNLTVSSPEDRLRKPDSVGLPVLFAEVRVVDADGRDAPVGETGEVIGRSPNSILGYFANPQKTAEAFRNGWFHTGDLGAFDDEGYLYIRGRVKDMIITGGQNVHSSEVEAVVLACPGVSDCAVFGLPDPVWGEVVAVAIVPSGEPPDAESLQSACREKLAGFKVPRRVFVRQDPLPRTPTGKVQKFLLVERYGSPAHGA
jgi:fatty-acyl-CoA synthase